MKKVLEERVRSWSKIFAIGFDSEFHYYLTIVNSNFWLLLKTYVTICYFLPVFFAGRKQTTEIYPTTDQDQEMRIEKDQETRSERDPEIRGEKDQEVRIERNAKFYADSFQSEAMFDAPLALKLIGEPHGFWLH